MEESRYGKVLLVEDDEGIAGLVRVALETANFHLTHVNEGRAGLQSAVSGGFDVILLDVNLPGMDGLTILREAKKACNTPIMMLSARQDDFDKILGLEIGADDYLGKPFNPLELVARVRALQRRGAPLVAVPVAAAPPASSSEPSEILQVGELEIDSGARQVKVNGSEVHLTATEFEVLVTLASRPNRVLTRQQLMDMCWGPTWVGDEKTVEVHLRRMRKKMQAFTRHDYIQAVRGVGYRISPP